MKTIAVISRKGGAGKTTVAVNLAILAHAKGKRVLLVDSDPQRSSSMSLKARQAPGPDVLETQPGKLFQLGIAAVKNGYDLMIIDTPACPETDVALAINCADLCVVACRPTFLDIASVVQSADMLRRLGREGAVVLNQTPPARMGIEPPSVRRATDALALTGLPVLAIVASRMGYQQSLAEGRSAWEWGSEPAEQDFALLWSALDGFLADRPLTSMIRTPVPQRQHHMYLQA